VAEEQVSCQTDQDRNVIVISKLLKRYSKAKRTSLFTSAATNQMGTRFLIFQKS